jgi:predicted rRNA methylase YqxC with S4 and FtsJ domains
VKVTLRDLIIAKKLLPNESVDIYIKVGKILVNDEMNRFPYSKVNKNATIRIKHSKQ